MRVIKKFTGFLTSQLRGGHFLFPAIALLLLILVSSFTVYNLVFLVSQFNKAFSPSAKPAAPPRFDIGAFEKLNLIRR